MRVRLEANDVKHAAHVQVVAIRRVRWGAVKHVQGSSCEDEVQEDSNHNHDRHERVGVGGEQTALTNAHHPPLVSQLECKRHPKHHGGCKGKEHGHEPLGHVAEFWKRALRSRELQV